MTTTTPNLFALEGKALDAPVRTERGDLILQGYAAVWNGLDFQNENFIRGAFREAIPEFLNGQATLAWHHDVSKGLGRVLELEEDDIGVRFKALVHRQEPSSPLHYLYDGIRRGIYRGVSVAGAFARAMTAAGLRIRSVRLAEISITARPSHPGTWATATEVKALMDTSPVDAFNTWKREALRVVELSRLELEVLALSN